MAASATAAWLDSFFAGYDHFFLNILHVLGDKAGTVLTPLMRLITFLGEKGIVFFLLALIFMLMADKRDLGVCIFGAVCCGALITNIILKDSVGRVRPFEAVPEYNEWWFAIGAPSEDGCSFPSGHVTACAAGMTAITLMRGKKWIVPSVLIVFIMGVSRNYLMAHYPSDVLFAVIIGVFSGVVAWLITQLIFRFLRRGRRNPLCAAILDFDIRDVLPLPAFTSGNAGKKPARPSRGTVPARRGSPRARPDTGAENTDDDVKTYTGSGRHAAPAPAGRSPIFEKPAAVKRVGRNTADEPTARRSRQVIGKTEPSPRRVRREPDEPESSRRRLLEEADDAELSLRRIQAEADASEPTPPERPAEPDAAAPVPRRSRTGGAHSAPSRAAGGAVGRHLLGASKESSPRVSFVPAKSRFSGGYQGKHVK